jgi:hypothetical protein
MLPIAFQTKWSRVLRLSTGQPTMQRTWLAVAFSLERSAGVTMAHFVTDKIVVGLHRAGLTLFVLTAVAVISSIAFTNTADGLLGAVTVAVLAFGFPGLGVFILAYWLDAQTAKIEGHPGRLRVIPRDDDARHPFRAPIAGYATATIATLLAWVARAFIDPFLPGSVPFVTFFLAIAIGGWFGGYGPAVLAVALCTMIARYFYMEPLHGLMPGDASAAIRLGSFVFVGLIIGGLTAALRAALQRVTTLASRVDALEVEKRAQRSDE